MSKCDGGDCRVPRAVSAKPVLLETLIRSSNRSPSCRFPRWSAAGATSGRRTFSTGAARKISTVGGSLRDVQMLAGHAALSTTQRYIEADVEAQRKVVDLI